MRRSLAHARLRTLPASVTPSTCATEAVGAVLALAAQKGKILAAVRTPEEGKAQASARRWGPKVSDGLVDSTKEPRNLVVLQPDPECRHTVEFRERRQVTGQALGLVRSESNSRVDEDSAGTHSPLKCIADYAGDEWQHCSFGLASAGIGGHNERVVRVSAPPGPEQGLKRPDLKTGECWVLRMPLTSQHSPYALDGLCRDRMVPRSSP